MEWVEIKGSSVEVAVEAGLAELKLKSADQADIEVIQEPERGFLGIGRRDAVIRVKPKPKRQRKRQRTRKPAAAGKSGRREREKPQSGRNPQARNRQSGKGDGKPKEERRPNKPNRSNPPKKKVENRVRSDETPEVSIEERAEVAKEFLEGLLAAFGLEGTVTTSVDEDFVKVDIDGEQTEALIGPRGTIIQAIHELTRTVVQRKTHSGTRLRLDIGGYSERRREALNIYGRRLAEQVLEEGGEAMLEPMNPADRKVIHDAVGEVEGVRSFSEGEEPRRWVVISAE